MKRSLQEVVELVVFGLIALLVGTGLLWLLGWLLSLGGLLFKAIAGLLWLLLRYIVPVAIVAGLVYFLVKALQDKQPAPAAASGATPPPAPPAPAPVISQAESPSQPAATEAETSSEKPKPRSRKSAKPPAEDSAADGSTQGTDDNQDEHS